MKPKLILNRGQWFCIGGAVVARGNDMEAAYRRWYQLCCIEA